jgi:hypothetical protein
MAQEYVIRAWEKGDFQDNHGNYWCTAVFEGVGEPVKVVVKDPTKFNVDDKLYGDVTEQKSKAGNTYLRFKRVSNTEAPQGGSKPQGQSDEYWEEKNAQIKAQWAIGKAIEWGRGDKDEVNIERDAKILFAMVDRVSGKEQPQESTEDAEAKSLADSLDKGVQINLDDVEL